MSERVLLKLGGSVITDKGSGGVIREDVISDLSDSIAARKGTSFVIVHGAGSCGHPEADRYRIAAGVGNDNREGIWITHRAVSRLNDRVVQSLRDHGVEAVGIQSLSSCIADNGRLVSCENRPLEKMLGLGMVPVLHGDVVMDMSRGACIVSGDQLVRVLSLSLHIDRIGLATDVNGVFGDGSVIPEITPGMADTLTFTDPKHTDVTGGMKGKVQELLLLAGAGVPSDIFHVSRTGDFLDHRPHGGTKVRGDAGV
jgi:isopentenyl phosphate kinase